jgi:hypothetical protein
MPPEHHSDADGPLPSALAIVVADGAGIAGGAVQLRTVAQVTAFLAQTRDSAHAALDVLGGRIRGNVGLFVAEGVVTWTVASMTEIEHGWAGSVAYTAASGLMTLAALADDQETTQFYVLPQLSGGLIAGACTAVLGDSYFAAVPVAAVVGQAVGLGAAYLMARRAAALMAHA